VRIKGQRKILMLKGGENIGVEMTMWTRDQDIERIVTMKRILKSLKIRRAIGGDTEAAGRAEMVTKDGEEIYLTTKRRGVREDDDGHGLPKIQSSRSHDIPPDHQEESETSLPDRR